MGGSILTNLFGKIYGGLLYIAELMIVSYRGMGSFTNAFSINLNTIDLNIFIGISKDLSLRLIVVWGFKCVMPSFPYADTDLGYWHISWKVNTRNRELNLQSKLHTLCLRGEDFIQGLSSYLTSKVWWPAPWCPDYRTILDLPNYW